MFLPSCSCSEQNCRAHFCSHQQISPAQSLVVGACPSRQDPDTLPTGPSRFPSPLGRLLPSLLDSSPCRGMFASMEAFGEHKGWTLGRSVVILHGPMLSQETISLVDGGSEMGSLPLDHSPSETDPGNRSVLPKSLAPLLDRGLVGGSRKEGRLAARARSLLRPA